MILAVAMVVLGPDKLPKLAGQIGGLWRDLQKWRERLEHEARASFLTYLLRNDHVGRPISSVVSGPNGGYAHGVSCADEPRFS